MTDGVKILNGQVESGFEGKAGVDQKAVEQVGAVLDALEPVADDRQKVVDTADGHFHVLDPPPQRVHQGARLTVRRRNTVVVLATAIWPE
ncbi:hypothetical protein QTQ03_29985 [Micromonospora sp. WMMA1363]|uniref:hypothetical protein n=1 Tax=Micromonospora sp. WMMA1363 TaxID=3053985 RepID=UPI00259D05C8|nr:hypothetical protein [Micromonospora sp. WMMA1363]MDM4723437.1 hypothetical protein [Micromonospora sp. WMMA1363]MDM4723593.1 hypothetical protein [Micromonospora sp. WMMA1363]